MKAISSVSKEVRAVSAAWNARPCHKQTIRSAVEVDQLIRSGLVEECSAERGQQKGWDEYFNYAIQLPAFVRFFDEACPAAARRSVYADLAFLSYIKNAVCTARFKPSSLGFAHNWTYLYDKPIHTDAAAESVSAGVTPNDSDAFVTKRLHKILLLSCWSHEALLLLAARQRSIIELFCVSFVGAPNPVPLQFFLLLGKLALLDQLETLGYNTLTQSNDSDWNLLVDERLKYAASAFAVPTWPKVATVPAFSSNEDPVS